jgi:hypothetical protein
VTLKTFIKNKASNHGACYEVSANLISPTNYHSNIAYLQENIIVAKRYKFFLYALKFIRVRNRKIVPND